MSDIFSLQNQHHRVNASDLEVNLREVWQFLGYHHIEPDERVSAIIDDCINEVKACATPQGIYSVFEIRRDEAENELDLGFARVHSKDLYKNMSACHHCVLFAATIGPKVDQLIQRTSRIDTLRGCVLDAVSSALIESYCDVLNEQIKKDFEAVGCNLRPRFSPGYGDFSINHQWDIFKSIRADKTIGLTLMDSGMMAPCKSVTALIGVYDTDAEKTPDYLPSCGMCKTCIKK